MLKHVSFAAFLIIFRAFPLHADDQPALVSFKVMALETAQKLAQATLDDCRKKGYQVAVSVVDRFGTVQVTLRDRFASVHTPETARRKAWTAISFRTDTITMWEQTKTGTTASGIRFVRDALMAGGGVPVEAAGSIVGGIGVSGAPGGDIDDECARVGIESIADLLEF